MNGKPKFSKLRLPGSKRNKNGSTSQISQFFSNSHQIESSTFNDDSKDCSHLDPNSNSSVDRSDHEFISMPDPYPADSPSDSHAKPSFSSFEALNPAKLRRLDHDKSGNRSTIKEFFTSQANESDFESTQKVVKKATTLKLTKQRTRSNTSKKQPKIKNALFKREQMLSSFIVEQSKAEDVDPNEMQMALALSRSEVETCRVENEDSNGSSNSVEVIREKLQEFGYRAGQSNKGKSFFVAPKARGKWANKFTSLTLRDPEHQQRKVNEKVERFLNSQYTTIESGESTSKGQFAISSSLLSDMKSDKVAISLYHGDYEHSEITKFYVSNICEPSGNKVGNLLKNFRTIPGRDLSPRKKDLAGKSGTEVVNQAKNQSGCEENKNCDISEKLDESPIESNSESNRENNNQNIELDPPLVEPNGNCGRENSDQNFFREASPDLFLDEEDEVCVESTSVEQSTDPKEVCYEEAVAEKQDSKNSNSVPSADERIQPTVTESNQCPEIVSLSSESNSNDIMTCEKFSSDEVRTVDRSGIWNQDLNYTLQSLREVENGNKVNTSQDDFIDLTQANIDPDKHTELSDQEGQLQVSVSLQHQDDTEDNASCDSDKIIDTSQENFIDLTQGDIDPDMISASDCEEPLPHSSQKSMRFNDEENLSQNSTSSIIVLSDDEVNYSIKVAKGFDVSANTTDTSEGTNITMNERDESSASSKRHSTDACDIDGGFSDMRYDSPIGELGNNEDNNESAQKCNNLSTNFCDDNPDAFNYSLAHEIMSHSFQEEFEKLNPVAADGEQEVQLPRVTTEEIVCLDLTEPTPPDQDMITPHCSKYNGNASINSSRSFGKTHSDSFLLPKNKTPSALKRFSSSKKFDEFINNDCYNDDNYFDEDEFDRLVNAEQQYAKRAHQPKDLNTLLTGAMKSPNDSFEEITIDDKIYLVKTQNMKPKPDYQRMDSPTRLKELYKFGLKPLKRKQAIVMLEYIYNQTHPYLVEDNEDDEIEINAHGCDGEDSNQHDLDDFEGLGTQVALEKLNKYDLKDCSGACLVAEDGLRSETDNEEYIFQTNVRSKICTALLPFHIAWFNLVKSSQKLREAILYYEPIDLQEIYIFFKSIGYRYDPKDLKRFFDGRSIIFQYDLKKEGANRHIRKPRRKNR